MIGESGSVRSASNPHTSRKVHLAAALWELAEASVFIRLCRNPREAR